MILFIDNYDSFTYNLVDYLGQLEPNLLVLRNDRITTEQIRSLAPAGIVLSPGPGSPKTAGVSCEIIAAFAKTVPILGICLGHQCIGEVFGARIVRAPEPVHGKTSSIYHSGHNVFAGLPNPFPATRYHSLMVERGSLPPVLEVIAETEDGLIMGLQHKTFPVLGLQFHPESILTVQGFEILQNWLKEYVYKEKATAV